MPTPTPTPSSASAANTTTTTTSTTDTNTDLEPIYFWSHRTKEYRFLSQWYEADFTAPVPTFAPSLSSSASDPTTTTTTLPNTTNPPPALLLTFSCCEQYMMYAKALLFDDAQIAEQVLLADNPGKQKALGRKVRGFDEEVWVQWRERVVEDANWYKFTRGGKKEEDGEEGEERREREKEREKEREREERLVQKGKWKGKGRKAVGLRGKLLATGRREIVEASPLDRIWGVGFSPDKAAANRKHWGLNLLGKALMRVRERLREEEEAEEEEDEEERERERKKMEEGGGYE